jgi:hypothetical protein
LGVNKRLCHLSLVIDDLDLALPDWDSHHFLCARMTLHSKLPRGFQPCLLLAIRLRISSAVLGGACFAGWS